MKIGIVGDAHLGCSDFSQRRRADFSAAFTNALTLCRKNDAAVICLLGDVFDSAAIRRNVDAFADLLAEIAPILETLKREGVPLVAIPGNHEFGRGREAGELRALESLGYLNVLRRSYLAFGDLGICGIPWQEDPAEIAQAADELRESCKSKRRILLLHNYIRDSRIIPDFLWEVNKQVAEGFDRVFVGHHHVYEEIGRFAIPGSTEVQNMLDEGAKGILIFDSDKDVLDRHLLPPTHPTIVLRYDASHFAGPDLLDKLRADLSTVQSKGAFVYVHVAGLVHAGVTISKGELLAVLRECDLFDSYIDLRHHTIAQTAKQSITGTSIDGQLRRTFSGVSLQKAKDYISATQDADAMFVKIRDQILS
jgi:DNA repair exonuclease SbcCD nuclease subunit